MPTTHSVEVDVAQHNRAPRWACDTEVAIIDEHGQELVGRIGNLSEGGFMVECNQVVRLGSVVRADIPRRGRVVAEIRWILGRRFGAMILRGT